MLPNPLAFPQTEASYLLVGANGQVLQAEGNFGRGLASPQVGTSLDESYAFLLDYLFADAPLYLPKIQLQQDHYFDIHVLPLPEASWVVFLYLNV
jgi:hypothetical protein